jgi:HK97 family phage major capsid protein
MTWDGSPSRFSDEQYARACILDRGPDAGPPKQRYSLPVRDPDGTLNCDGVASAKAMVGKVKASPELIAAAKAKLEKLASQCEEKRSEGNVTRALHFARPEPGQVEERSLGDLTVEDRKLRGVVPYGVESADLGGWREVIEPRALHSTSFDDLIVTVDHAGLPLGRYPGTLELEDRADGLHWACEPPRSRQDVLEAVERGDLKASSWRMVVARDRWEGDVRHVEEIRSLKDVAVVVSPAYPAATAELRSDPNTTRMSHLPEPEPEEEATVPEPEEEAVPTGGGLTVESRNADAGASVESRVLEAMRGVPKGESRSLTTSTVDSVTPPDLQTFLWDLLRDNSVVLQSGVRLFTTSRKSISWPELTQDMQADFFDELDEITATDLDFDTFELEPKKIAALARGSSEAFDDSDPSLMQIVTSNLGTILGLKFDAQCLTGDTATTPKGFDGLVKLAGQTINVGGPLVNYDPFIEAFGALAEQHVPPPYVVVTHPRVTTALDLVKEYTASQSNVGLPRPVGFPPVYVTSQIGLTTGTTPTTTALVYAPRFVTVVRRMDTTIEIDRSAEFTTDAVLVRGRVRVTIGSPHTNAIVKLTGINAPVIGGVTVSGTSAQPQVQQAKAATTARK